MTAPDEKAREVATDLVTQYRADAHERPNRLISAIAAALIEARRAALEEAASASDQWPKPQVVKLAAGEMSAQELRTAQAVAGGHRQIDAYQAGLARLYAAAPPPISGAGQNEEGR